MTISKPLCILFADVSGSTKLFEQRGDLEARRLISAVLDALSQVCVAQHGKVIKTIGDEIMCTLPDALAGITAACEMQKRISDDLEFIKNNIAIRIGLHYGDALIEAEDVFGDAVNVAARMAELAKRQEIVTTATTYQSLPDPDLFRYREMGKTRVHGKSAPIAIIDIVWHDDAALNSTQMDSGLFRAMRKDLAPTSATKLTLRYRDTVIELDEHSPAFTIGRDATSSLVVNVECVSRIHALVEFKKSFFVFADRSSNASYFKFSDGDKVRLHRDEMPLRQSGEISLGQIFDKNQGDVVYFECSY